MLQPTEIDRLLVVMAHPDDVDFGSAGTMATLTALGVQGGALEGSNVSPVETMVAMIAAARQFEQQMKSLQGAEQREQGAAKLLGPQ